MPNWALTHALTFPQSLLASPHRGGEATLVLKVQRGNLTGDIAGDFTTCTTIASCARSALVKQSVLAIQAWRGQSVFE